MNQLYQINRELREIKDPLISEREHQIKKIQVSYGYDRENAEKIIEYQEVESVKNMFGLFCGSIAALKFNPIQRDLAKRHALFRKVWMRYPLQALIFGGVYYTAVQIPSRIHKLTNKNGVSQEVAMSQTDLVARFRMFEEPIPCIGAEEGIVDYLHQYSDKPFVKDELLERLAEMKRLGKNLRIRRMGKDENDLFWSFGKIHGLENIIYVDKDELIKTAGDPIKLQRLVNNAKPKVDIDIPFEEKEMKLNQFMKDFKEHVSVIGLAESDRKKILSLPIYLAKRTQNPEPKRGQKEFDFFTNFTGKEYTADWSVILDKENKITEFEFEKFLNPALLKRVNAQKNEFLHFVRKQNFSSSTQLEQLKDDKKQFSQLMEILPKLTADEQRDLVHLVNNQRGKADFGEEDQEEIYDFLVAFEPEVEKKMAEVSETENFNLKNRYRHDKRTMQYADKKRMPIHESKVADLLRNSHIYRQKIKDEVFTFQPQQENTQMENGVLTYVNEAAYGELRDLITDIGIKDDTIEFTNLKALNKLAEQKVYAGDNQIKYLQNALYTPIDMTDYEDHFVSWREMQGALPIANSQLLLDLQQDPFPQINTLVEKMIPENAPMWSTGPSMTAMMEAVRVVPEPEEDDMAEEEEDAEYGEEGEEAEYGAEDYGEEEVPVVTPREWPAKDQIKGGKVDSRVFRGNEKLRSRFNEVEIDNFMKLLAIKPHVQWQDQSFFHYKLGAHKYEDLHQQHDIDFHLLSESERKHAEYIATKEWRKGTEVRFVLGEKQPEWSNRKI